MAKRSKFWPGRIFRATAQFRIGMGSGPNRDGICAKGDYFIVVEAHDEDPTLLCLSESVRRGCHYKSYPVLDCLKPASKKEILRMGAHLEEVRIETRAKWGLV